MGFCLQHYPNANYVRMQGVNYHEDIFRALAMDKAWPKTVRLEIGADGTVRLGKAPLPASAPAPEPPNPGSEAIPEPPKPKSLRKPPRHKMVEAPPESK